MEDLREVESELKFKSLVVDEVKFQRDCSIAEKLNLKNSKTEFSCQIEELEQGDYLVSLGIRMRHKDNETELSIKMSGLFGFEGEADIDFKNEMLEKNAVSIVFPYLRSQLSILTTQPGMEPIVLPAINILRLLKIED